MDGNFTSELTMLASLKFIDIIDQVKKSSLNFQVQLSPFSALISLKKSFVSDRAGNPLQPLAEIKNCVPNVTIEKLTIENKA